jgi:hypothetical protein
MTGVLDLPLSSGCALCSDRNLSHKSVSLVAPIDLDWSYQLPKDSSTAQVDHHAAKPRIHRHNLNY